MGIKREIVKGHLQKTPGTGTWGIWKKAAAMALTVVMLGSLLGGCQKSADNGQTKIQGESQTGGENGQTGLKDTKGNQGKEETNPGAGSQTAMGRYIETPVELPEGIETEDLVTCFFGEDGILELYTASIDGEGHNIGARRFLRKEDTWTEDPGWWDERKERLPFFSLWHVVYGQDGKYYIGGVDEDYIYHLCRIDGEQEETELIPDTFLPPEGKEYGNNPSKVEVTRDGNILIHTYKEASYYRPDGSKLFTLKKDWSGSTEDSIGFVEGDEFVTQSEGQVVRYSLDNGQVTEKIPYMNLEPDTGETSRMFGDGEGGIYVANETGLAHAGRGSTIWELLIDGSLNTMGMRSMHMRCFFMGEENDYYGVYTGEMGIGIEICHYTFDADTSSAPPVSLTVYGLEDNSTVRQAASLFQKDHPEVRVEVLDAGIDEGGVVEEIIRALNTELLSGNGADVLILDGLPAQSYEEKGILMDLRDVFAEIQKDSPVMETVLKGFTGEDGSIYQMPARISMPVVIGSKESLAAYEDLAHLRAYQGEKPLVVPETYENLLRQVAALQYEEVLGDGIEGLTREKLKEYLETVKILGTSCGAKVQFSEAEADQYWVNNYGMAYGIRGTFMHYDGGIAGSGMDNLRGFFDAAIPLAIGKRHPEDQIQPAGNIYFPTTRVGVNQATRQPELAKEFIWYVFSTEVQKEEFYDGFPVGTEAQEIQTAKEKELYTIGASIGDYIITGDWPSLEERTELMEMVRGLKTPVIIDETVMEMIINGSKDYFEDKSTVDQAAAAISQQIMLYLAEQE